jgi:hypothetical protein
MLCLVAGSCAAASGSSNPWPIALFSAVAALVGVLIAQLVVLRLHRRDEDKRIDPELLRQCSEFSVAVDEFKQRFDAGLPLSEEWLERLQAASTSLDLTGPDSLLEITDRLVGNIGALLFAKSRPGFDIDQKATTTKLFRDHVEFTQAARKYFGQTPRIHRAIPMITSDDL